jgi:hypothetical protein
MQKCRGEAPPTECRQMLTFCASCTADALFLDPTVWIADGYIELHSSGLDALEVGHVSI